MSEPIHIISLGAGVQSSTMALMAAKGEITPMPKAAIFADTQAEPKAVYDWLAWLEKNIPFPIIKVSGGNLLKESLRIRISGKTGKEYLKWSIPAYGLKENGKKSLLGRQCTADFKIRPIIKATRGLCDWKRGEKRPLVKMWIGISYDEIIRMKPSREPWIKHLWPMIDMKMTRNSCLSWMEKNGYPEPPRSACIFCPFHSDDEWRKVKSNPAEWAQVVQYEKDLQTAGLRDKLFKSVAYLHKSCKPISEVDFTEKKDTHGQISLFGNECEGMCGV